MALQLGVAAVGAGMSYFQGKKMEKDAKDKIMSYQRQALTNVNKDRSVSTLGADLQTEELNKNTATATEALRGAGTRGILGGMGQITENTNEVNRRVAADLDMQQKQIDESVAEDDARIRGMVEERQNAELSGYSNMMNVGMGMKYQGINQFVNTLGAAAATKAANKAEASGKKYKTQFEQMGTQFK
jgi:hypothetical protein